MTKWLKFAKSMIRNLCLNKSKNIHRRGKWEGEMRGKYKVWDTLHDPRCRGMCMWKCSECGHKTFGARGSNYCSNCGSKMNGI